MEEKKLTYDIETAGRLLGLSRPSAYLAAKRGQIPTLRLGHRLVVPVAALMKMLENAGATKEER
jgi:hypothetical protein